MGTLTTLQKNIQARRTTKSVLVMSHTVMGYPSLAYNHEQVRTLAESGVDIIELQFPFSDPMADGPVLSKANQESLENGTTIEHCFTEAKKITSAFQSTMFVIMTYYNVIYAYGKEAFLTKAKECGIQGIIVPDLPPDEDEAHDYVKAADATDIATIFLCTPFTSLERLNYISQYARGLIYCVARLGTTGRHTKFGPDFETYINNVKKSFALPIGVGFGIQTSDDVNHLKRVGADIAIICSHVIKMSMEKGLPAVKEYLNGIADATK
jgi:tryptophan synthase alpha chain